MVRKVVKIYQKCSNVPFGKFISFSKIFRLWATYLRTINAFVEDLKPGYVQVSMKQRWAVQNQHIKTVHAIAVCNLVEMAMGLQAEASIPDHLRWLP